MPCKNTLYACKSQIYCGLFCCYNTPFSLLICFVIFSLKKVLPLHPISHESGQYSTRIRGDRGKGRVLWL